MPELYELIERLGSPNPQTRFAVLTALGKRKEEDTLPAVIGRLDDEDPGVRVNAAQVLKIFKDRRAVPALCKALNDKHEDVRASAAIALGEIGDRIAISDLAEILNDKDTGVRYSAAVAIGKIELKNPASVSYAMIQRKLEEFIEKSKNREAAKLAAAKSYMNMIEVISKGGEKLDMPGELLPDKPKGPKKMFRKRLWHA